MLLLLEVIHRLRPAHVLRRQPADEPVRQLDRLVRRLRLLLAAQLLGGRLLELRRQLAERLLQREDLVLDLAQLLLRVGQLLVGRLERQPLRLHLAEHLVERDDVDRPGAQAARCQRLRLYVLRLELWIVEVRLDRLQARVRDVLLVIVDQLVQEVVHLRNDTPF